MSVGDMILVLRRSRGITQEELAQRLGITQAALSRYENDLREPDPATLVCLGDALGVTEKFLSHEFQHLGAIAADAHMRRQKTAKPSDWKHVEAQLNLHRMHTAFLVNRVPLRPHNHVMRIDPEERTPAEAAEICRAMWKMPLGPIKNLTHWVESAGVIIIEEDFGTRRIDGMSQWAGEHAVILLNDRLPTDRKRFTLAHELGHLVLHSEYLDVDVEDQANQFAAAFLMPATHIGPELNNLTMGKLVDLKAKWGASMQAIYERAYLLGKVTAEDREHFYRQMTKRGWKTTEPGLDRLRPEAPELASAIGEKLKDGGLTMDEVCTIIGVQPEVDSPFLPPQLSRRGFRIV